MKHLKKFNESVDNSDLKEINDLLIDLRELYFELEVNRLSSNYIKVYGKLASIDYSIKDVSTAFEDVKKRLESIYQKKITFQLKCSATGSEIQIDIITDDPDEDEEALPTSRIRIPKWNNIYGE